MKTVSVFTATLAAVLATTGLLLWFDLVEATKTIPTYAALQAIDLYVEVFTMTPSSGRINEPVAFDIRICNAAGSDSIPGSRVNLYVDPPDQPPLTTTQKTKEFVQYVTWDPGICYTWQYQYSFGQSGKHVAYAWVDPYERIAESDEANNLVEIRFSIEPEIPPGSQDAYEPDDTCDQAQEINTDGTVQTHKFDPLGDVDWVRFQATAGQVYTITAVGTGADGYPTFEVWESCSIPPGSFGGTSFRLIWTASTSGEYYLKLDNDRDDYDPVESGYQLTIRGETVITGTQPSVEGISPAWGTNDRNTNVIISGTNFSAPPRASLCPYYPGTTAWCGDCTYPLQNTSWPGSDRIFAVVPANLPNGAYCLAVTNPGGKTDTLLDAFTVLPGQPDLWEIHPLRGYADAPNDLHVYGFNFHPDISVTLGITPLENVVVVNQTYLRGTAPAGLPPGDYTLRAFYETGDADILPGGYAVMAVNDDLFAQEGELWVDPVAPRAGETTRLGLLVHRESVTSALPTHVEVGLTAPTWGQSTCRYSHPMSKRARGGSSGPHRRPANTPSERLSTLRTRSPRPAKRTTSSLALSLSSPRPAPTENLPKWDLCSSKIPPRRRRTRV